MTVVMPLERKMAPVCSTSQSRSKSSFGILMVKQCGINKHNIKSRNTQRNSLMTLFVKNCVVEPTLCGPSQSQTLTFTSKACKHAHTISPCTYRFTMEGDI